MYIVRCGNFCGIGETVQEAVNDYEFGSDESFDPEECLVYEAKEIQVRRKFEVIKED